MYPGHWVVHNSGRKLELGSFHAINFNNQSVEIAKPVTIDYFKQNCHQGKNELYHLGSPRTSY
jgi:hypothetical protein